MSLKKVFVTGGNAGIGFALCKQLVSEDKVHVYLGSRSESKGKAAVQEIKKEFPEAQVELVVVDVSNDESVKAAAASMSGNTFYGLVNNAGTGLGHGDVSPKDIINTNLLGPKRVSEAFLPLLDAKQGRIVNVSSGLASGYVSGTAMGRPMGVCSKEERLRLADFNVTWDQIMGVVKKEEDSMDGLVAYGLSKAALTAYTMLLARTTPHILSTSCSPGFINTNMTKGFGAKLQPEQGTVSLRHCLFGDNLGNGWYIGSDGKRSPLTTGRDPGDPEYNPGEGEY